MNKKIIILSASVAVLVIFVIFIGSTDFLKEDVLSLESNEIPVYIPSDITKANPNFVLSGGGFSMASMTRSQVIELFDYALEGTVIDIDEPILYVNSSSDVDAAIPIIMSVEKVHKGNLDSNIFTFYVNARVLIDGYRAQSHSALGIDTPSLIHSAFRDYTVSDILSSENITYSIHEYSDQYEIGDKIIIYLGEDKYRTDSFDSERYVMISNYDLTPYYTTMSGAIDVIKIQNGVMFGYGGIVQTEIFDSKKLPIPYVNLISDGVNP